MADMLLRGPRKTWGHCTCPDCIMGSRRDVRRANRPADKRAWQRDVQRGEYDNSRGVETQRHPESMSW